MQEIHNTRSVIWKKLLLTYCVAVFCSFILSAPKASAESSPSKEKWSSSQRNPYVGFSAGIGSSIGSSMDNATLAKNHAIVPLEFLMGNTIKGGDWFVMPMEMAIGHLNSSISANFAKEKPYSDLRPEFAAAVESYRKYRTFTLHPKNNKIYIYNNNSIAIDENVIPNPFVTVRATSNFCVTLQKSPHPLYYQNDFDRF